MGAIVPQLILKKLVLLLLTTTLWRGGRGGGVSQLCQRHFPGICGDLGGGLQDQVAEGSVSVGFTGLPQPRRLMGSVCPAARPAGARWRRQPGCVSSHVSPTPPATQVPPDWVLGPGQAGPLTGRGCL